MATYQINANQATMAATAKGTMALWSPSGALRRLKIYEFDVGATNVPNATDCNITIDISRMIGTTSVAGTAYTPNNTDPADGAADATSLVNITTELAAALVSTALPEYHNGMNQRNTIRWVAAQESQFLICNATALNGHYLTALSPNYTGASASLSSNVYYLE